MRKTTPTLLFMSIALAFAAQAQAQSNNPANNPSRNITMQSGSTAVTPQARAGAQGNVITPNPNQRFVRVRNFVEVEPGVFAEVFVQDPATVEAAAAQAAASANSGTTSASSTTTSSGLTAGVLVTTDANGNVVEYTDTTTSSGNVTEANKPLYTPELDKAVARQRLKDQKTVAINGQRWNMIIPRTTVDRTHQMADDPPSPLLGR